MDLALAYTRTAGDESADEYALGDMVFSRYDALLNFGGELEELAQAQGVTSLSEFSDTGDDTDPFPAAEGLKTVNALLAAIPEADIIDAEDLVEELTRLREELEMLHANGWGFLFEIS